MMTFQEAMSFLGMKFFQVLMATLGFATGLGTFFVIAFALFVFSWTYFIYCNVRTRDAD